MNWDWVVWGIGILAAAGLVVLAAIEFVSATFDDGRTRWRLERAAFGVVYLGVAWFTTGNSAGAAVCAVALGVIVFMRIVR